MRTRYLVVHCKLKRFDTMGPPNIVVKVEGDSEWSMASKTSPNSSSVASKTSPKSSSSKRNMTRPEASNSALFAMHALNATGTDTPLPRNTTRMDVHVVVSTSLEQDKENKTTQDTAEKVKTFVEKKLRNWYSGVPNCAFLLKVYVVKATPGRLTAAGALCLEWFLQTSDGSTTYKSGRVGEELSFFHGKLAITQTIPQGLVDKIVKAIDIANRSASLKVCS